MTETLRPQKGKQEIAAQTNVDIMIYGGAAGCVDGETQFLSERGWINISDYKEGDYVTVYDDVNDTYTLELPEEYVKKPCEDLYRIYGEEIDHVVSSEHWLLYKDLNDELCITTLLESAEKIQNNPLNFKFIKPDGGHCYAGGVEYFKPVDKKKYCFHVSTGYFLVRRNGKELITGNSGKSRLLLLKAGYYACQDENFEGVIFRRTTKPLSAAGGLFTEAKKLYRPAGIRIREREMEIYFNDGGNLKFTHLEHEKDAEGNH